MSVGRLHRDPRRDEALSSWLINQSRLHGLPLQAYCAITFPGVELWTRDLDRWLPSRSAKALAEGTGLSEEAVHGMTLAGRYPRIIGTATAKHQGDGHLRVGVYHRSRRRHGQQVCRACIQSERVHLLRWRFAAFTECELHPNGMMDSCPYCDAPLVAFYAEGHDRWRCHRCDQSVLRGSSAPQDSNGPIERQLRLDCQRRLIWRTAPARMVQPSYRDFRALCSLQLRFPKGRRLLSLWLRECGISQGAGGVAPLEQARLRDRGRMFAATEHAVRKGANELVADLLSHGISQQLLNECGGEKAPWLRQFITPHLVDRPLVKRPKNYWAEWFDPLLSLRRSTRRCEPRERHGSRAALIQSLRGESRGH